MKIPATVFVDAGKPVGPLERLEQYNNLFGPKHGLLHERDMQWLRQFDLRLLKAWLPTRTPDKYAGYLAQASALAQAVMVNLGGAAEEVLDGRLSPEAYSRQVEQCLARYVELCPNIRYVECLNEFLRPGTHWSDVRRWPAYVEFFEAFRRAVDRVNEQLPAPRRLLLGGPVATHPGVGSFHRFLTLAAQRGLTLDFLSYHQYLFGNRRGNPAIVRLENLDLRPLLQATGQNRDMPIFVTEYGVFPQGTARSEGTSRFDRDVLTQAAGMLSTGLQYLDSGPSHPMPLHWVVRHGQNARKNQLVAGEPGVPTPYGNAMTLQRMLASQRVAALTEALEMHGIGVNVLASRDDHRLTVLLWNYQWTNRRRVYTVDVELSGFAPSRAACYRIDETYGNYLAGPHHTGLKAQSLTPSTSVRLDLGVNHICLLVFET